MTTHATIAIHNDDDTYTAIYLHMDGYPEAAGKTLDAHYNDEATIRRLMSLGDLSTLGEKPEDPGLLWDFEKVGIDGATKLKRESSVTLYHVWHLLTDTYCKSYRSRGEKHIDARTYKTEDELVENREQYLYAWDKDAGWRMACFADDGWRSLADVLSEIEAGEKSE